MVTVGSLKALLYIHHFKHHGAFKRLVAALPEKRIEEEERRKRREKREKRCRRRDGEEKREIWKRDGAEGYQNSWKSIFPL